MRNKQLYLLKWRLDGNPGYASSAWGGSTLLVRGKMVVSFGVDGKIVWASFDLQKVGGYGFPTDRMFSELIWDAVPAEEL